MSVIGKCGWKFDDVIVCTRFDIANVVRMVSRYIANSEKSPWEAMKFILRYLISTSRHGLMFEIV